MTDIPNRQAPKTNVSFKCEIRSGCVGKDVLAHCVLEPIQCVLATSGVSTLLGLTFETSRDIQIYNTLRKPFKVGEDWCAAAPALELSWKNHEKNHMAPLPAHAQSFFRGLYHLMFPGGRLLSSLWDGLKNRRVKPLWFEGQSFWIQPLLPCTVAVFFLQKEELFCWPADR